MPARLAQGGLFHSAHYELYLARPIASRTNSAVNATSTLADYTKARDAMIPRTHAAKAPWNIVKADDKKSTRLNIIRNILSRCEFHGKDKHGELPDFRVIFLFDQNHVKDGMISH